MTRSSTRITVAAAGLLLSLMASAMANEVPTDESKIARDGSRFLFVVETSSNNRKFESTNRQAVFDLIVNGIKGQMRTGDTFGLWTFSDEARAGDFPMMVWDKDRSLELAGKAAGFLQKQKYARKPNIENLISALRGLTEQVGEFNVLIVSTGRNEMKGTPYDEGINLGYASLTKQSVRSGRPMVTTFVVKRGRVVGASVVLAGDDIVLPERAPSIAKAEPKKPATTNSAVNVAGQSGPDPAAPPEPPRKKVIQIITKTNSPVIATTPAPSTPQSIDPPTSILAVNQAAPDSPSPAAPETSTLAAFTATPAPPGPPNPPANPAPTPAALEISPKTKPPAPTSAPVSASALVTTTAEALTPPPLTVAAREVPPKASPPSPSTEAPSLQAAAVPTPHGLSAGAMLAIGGTLLGAACFLVILVLRRTQPPARTSLITQSMERDWKG